MSTNVPIQNLRYAATKLALDVPELRPYLLPYLSRSVVAKEFPSDDALKKYLGEHPNADRNQHSVSKSDKPSKDKGFDFPGKGKPKEKPTPESPKGKTRERPKAGPSGWSDKDDNGNVFWGDKSQVIGDLATVKDSQLSGTISGKATVEGSKTSIGSRISDNASVIKSQIKGLVNIKDDAKVSGSSVDGHNLDIEGDTEITNASIEGGNWNGQKVKGGRWEDSYDQDVIDILSKFNSSKNPKRAGTGDGTIRAMTLWLSDGGRTKGLLGGKKKRKKMERAIEEHMRFAYTGNKHIHAQEGVQNLEKLSDEDFDKLMAVAQTKAAKKSNGKKGSMANTLRHDLIKLASANPEIRPYVLPLVMDASPELRKKAIRIAHANPELRHRILPMLVDKTAATSRGLEESVKSLKEQVAATKKALRDFAKNKGDDEKSEILGHLYKGKQLKSRMTVREMAKHLKMKERLLKEVEAEHRQLQKKSK